MKNNRIFQLSALVMVSVLLTTSGVILAHEDRKAGPYNLHVGWHVEPALLDQLNAVELTVTQDDKPVKDVEKTLTVTLATAGKTSDALSFVPSDETPGLYTAALIPTRTGDYQFHFVGMIGTTKIDETFDSAQGKFDSVEPTNNLQFPDQAPSNGELQKEIDALKAQIAALKGGTSNAIATSAATATK